MSFNKILFTIFSLILIFTAIVWQSASNQPTPYTPAPEFIMGTHLNEYDFNDLKAYLKELPSVSCEDPHDPEAFPTAGEIASFPTKYFAEVVVDPYTKETKMVAIKNCIFSDYAYSSEPIKERAPDSLFNF